MPLSGFGRLSSSPLGVLIQVRHEAWQSPQINKTYPGMFSPLMMTFSVWYGRTVMGDVLVPLFPTWMLADGAYVPPRRKMTSPAAAALTAAWIEPYGLSRVPDPDPVGET